MASRADLVLAGAVGVVVVAAVGAGVLATTRPPTSYDPASPAGVVQTYLRAVADHRTVDAAELLTLTSCDETDLGQAYLPEEFRVDLRSERVDQDVAQVEVVITQGSGDPFSGGWDQTQTFTLNRADGSWLLVGAPWPMGWCEPKVNS